jgi:5-keto-L-gluconate epimerase
MNSADKQFAIYEQHSSGNPRPFRLGVSLSPHISTFTPLLFAGRLYEGIESLSKYGFCAVEISLRNAHDVGDIAELDKRLNAYNLVVSAFATGRICLEDSLCLSDTRQEIKEQLFTRLSEIIKLAAHFKACVIIGGIRGKLSGVASEKAAQLSTAVETIRRCAEFADPLDVNLLVEPINRFETNFINSAHDGLEFIQAIGEPNVKLLLDTYHMNIEEDDPCAAIHLVGSQLGYVHFADHNRHAPGQGYINFPAVLSALNEIDYQGYITVEILPVPDDLHALADAGQYLSSLMFHKG